MSPHHKVAIWPQKWPKHIGQNTSKLAQKLYIHILSALMGNPAAVRLSINHSIFLLTDQSRPKLATTQKSGLYVLMAGPTVIVLAINHSIFIKCSYRHKAFRTQDGVSTPQSSSLIAKVAKCHFRCWITVRLRLKLGFLSTALIPMYNCADSCHLLSRHWLFSMFCMRLGSNKMSQVKSAGPCTILDLFVST